ncbi:MAG: hypothetical protein QOJ65_1973 [Fimbriimonadaceae bacterium]|jgi:hypothetical protein|nr:hypothetical protein [Fimbriimonadaceae bacterium]
MNARPLAVCAFLVLAGAAVADVKVVSLLRAPGLAGIGGPQQTITTYYKGGLVRTDAQGRTTILDTRKHTTTIIDHTSRTYSVLDTASMAKLQKETMKGMQVKVSGHVSPTKDQKSIQKKAARKYVADLNLVVSGPQLKGPQGPMKMNVKVHMDQWATTAVKANVSPDQAAGMLGQVLRGFTAIGGVGDLKREMGKIRGLPLDNQTKVTISMVPLKGKAPAGAGASQTMSVEIATQSVSEAPINPSVFKVPAGYTKTAKPMLRGRPGPGGR